MTSEQNNGITRRAVTIFCYRLTNCHFNQLEFVQYDLMQIRTATRSVVFYECFCLRKYEGTHTGSQKYVYRKYKWNREQMKYKKFRQNSSNEHKYQKYSI